jgi:hypothetical protein
MAKLLANKPIERFRAVLDYIKSTWPERERSYQLEVSRSE